MQAESEFQQNGAKEIRAKQSRAEQSRAEQTRHRIMAHRHDTRPLLDLIKAASQFTITISTTLTFPIPNIRRLELALFFGLDVGPGD